MTTPGDTSATFCATLVDEWIRQGVRHAVVAPGSRSTPLAVALARRSDIWLHVFHDERSASFAALGIGLTSGVPAVLLCTSGTAAAHFHAAVVEAHQSNVPMIVCTADRPPELRDVGAPQTIDQTRLYGDAVRWFHDPGVPADDASSSWRSLAARSFASSVGLRPGPVHLNLPFREPLLGAAASLPPARASQWSTSTSPVGVDVDALSSMAAGLDGRRGVIVAGRGATRDVLTLGDALGWPVFADARSGLREQREGVISGFDPLLRSVAFTEAHVPEVMLRVGEPPASKVLAQWSARLGIQVVQIQPTEMVIDPDHTVSMTMVGDVGQACAGLVQLVHPVADEWRSAWSSAGGIVENTIASWTSETFCEPTVARVVTGSLRAGSHFVVSSSMPIRDVEWFGAHTPGVTVHSNRGTNGIDGVISTAVGVALASGAPTTLLIGDVAAIHDSNGLWSLMARNVDLTIVVTNNDGGSIFSFLPQASQVDDSTFELLYGTPHGVSFEFLAKAHGVPFQRANNSRELAKALSMGGPRLVEVPLDRSVNVAQHEALNAAIVTAVESSL